MARAATSACVASSESLAAAIPAARTQEIEGSGHAAPFDATASFLQVIADAITA
jgi:pimeloyl-ACP methyl ester carboxylesterase